MLLASPPTNTSDILKLVATDMQHVDALIAQRLHSDVALVGNIAHYIIASGGKRLRPALLLMIFQALESTNTTADKDANKYKTMHHITLAAVVEFIHTATLLHDDVVDDSQLRRGRATANEHFGNPASVLVGDFLYSRAFQMMVDVQNLHIMSIVANATNVIAEGEVLQLMNMHNADLTQENYITVIESKTAKLFEASTRLASLLQGANAQIEAACAQYGMALGTAFQIIDDVLDYDGDTAVMGKNLGDDLREGKTTLPLIFAMKRCTPEQHQVLKHAITSGDASQMPLILNIIAQTKALDATREIAAQWAQRAIDAISPVSILPDGVYKTGLLQLAQQLLLRCV